RQRMQRITPETAPIGARLLIKDDDSRFAEPYEVIIIEWAPSGKAVKLRTGDRPARWSEKLPLYGVLFDVLPTRTPEKQAALHHFLSRVDCEFKFNDPEPPPSSPAPGELGHQNPNIRAGEDEKR